MVPLAFILFLYYCPLFVGPIQNCFIDNAYAQIDETQPSDSEQSPTPDTDTDTDATPRTDTDATPDLPAAPTPRTDTDATPDLPAAPTPRTDTDATPRTDTDATPRTDTDATLGTDTDATLGTDTAATPDVPAAPSPDVPAAPSPDVPAAPTLGTDTAATPDVPAAPSPDVPAAPSPDVPAAPSPDVPAAPSPDVPAAPSPDVPAAPSPDVPAAPSPDVPAAPSPDVPAAPSPDVPAAPSPDVPAAPSPDVPAAPSPDVPAAPSPDVPAAPSPDVPAAPSPDVPAAPSPDVPAAPSPDVPAAPSPDVPAAPSPDVPAAPSPDVPAAPSPDVPAAPSPDVPAAPSPDVPAAPSPDVPAAPSPDVPAAPSPDVPAAPSPDVPAAPSPDVPAAPSPDVPAAPSPDVPAAPSPDVPAAPSPDVPAAPSPDVPAAPVSIDQPFVAKDTPTVPIPPTSLINPPLKPLEKLSTSATKTNASLISGGDECTINHGLITFENLVDGQQLFSHVCGVVFTSGPKVVDLGSDDTIHAHSGQKAIEACYMSLEFITCEAPIEIAFKTLQKHVKAWLGFKNFPNSNVVMKAYDKSGNFISESSIAVKEKPITTPIEIFSGSSNIYRISINFESTGGGMYKELLLDDLEFDSGSNVGGSNPVPPTNGETVAQSCISTQNPVINLETPENGFVTRVNKLTLTGTVNTDTPLDSAMLTVTNSNNATKSYDLLGTNSGGGLLTGGKFSKHIADARRINDLPTDPYAVLSPGLNTISVTVKNCHGSFTGEKRDIQFNPYQTIPAKTTVVYLGMDIMQNDRVLKPNENPKADTPTSIRVYLNNPDAFEIQDVKGILHGYQPYEIRHTNTDVQKENVVMSPPDVPSSNAITIKSFSIDEQRKDSKSFLEFDLPLGWTYPGRIHLEIEPEVSDGSSYVWCRDPNYYTAAMTCLNYGSLGPNYITFDPKASSGSLLTATDGSTEKNLDSKPKKFKITFDSIYAHESHDTYGSAHWDLVGTINGKPIELLRSAEITGNAPDPYILPRPPTLGSNTMVITIPGNETFSIGAHGLERDSTPDDGVSPFRNLLESGFDNIPKFTDCINIVSSLEEKDGFFDIVKKIGGLDKCVKPFTDSQPSSNPNSGAKKDDSRINQNDINLHATSNPTVKELAEIGSIGTGVGTSLSKAIAAKTVIGAIGGYAAAAYGLYEFIDYLADYNPDDGIGIIQIDCSANMNPHFCLGTHTYKSVSNGVDSDSKGDYDLTITVEEIY